MVKTKRKLIPVGGEVSPPASASSVRLLRTCGVFGTPLSWVLPGSDTFKIHASAGRTLEQYLIKHDFFISPLSNN
jgi:hypothetical protein